MSWRFVHRTFQEYFAATSLSRLEGEKLQAAVAQRRDDQKWAEVLVLLTGMLTGEEVAIHLDMLLSAAGPHRTGLAIRALGEAPGGTVTPDLARRVLGLKDADTNGRRNIILGLSTWLRDPNDAVRALDIFRRVEGHAIAHSDLYFIGEALRKVNTRLAQEAEARRYEQFDLKLRKDHYLTWEKFKALMEQIVWCKVQQGEFEYGSSESETARYGNEPALRRVSLDSFWIARTAVTNELYSFFAPLHYVDFAEVAIEFKQENHPAVLVSWYNAMCFCEWISRWGEATYGAVRLPSEQEWEKAASWPVGGPKRRFPWGDEWELKKVNADQRVGGKTCPVDAHENGASPCGAVQMAGNVYEWTSSLLSEAAWDFRVIRGGSWGDSYVRCRNASRESFDPSQGSTFLGFRLVRVKELGGNDKPQESEH